MKSKKLIALMLAFGVSLTSIAQLNVGVFADGDSIEKNDFYEAVNSEWEENATLPEGEVYYCPAMEIQKSVFNNLINLLDKKLKDRDLIDNANEKKVVDLYDLILDKESRNEKGIEPILPLLNKIESISNKSDLIEVSDELMSMGINTFYSCDIGADYKDSSKNALFIETVNFDLPKDYFLSNDEKSGVVQKLYTDYLTDLFILSGETDVMAERKAKSAFEYQKILAKYTLSRQDEFDFVKTYNVYTIDKIKNDFSTLDVANSLEKLKFANSNIIIIRAPKYFEFVEKTIKQSQVSMLKNYMEAMVLTQTSELLSEDFDLAQANFNNQLNGTDSLKSDKERAMDFINKRFSWPLGEIYAKNFFSEEAKKDIESIVEEVIKAYRVRLENNAWLSSETKKNAIEKLDAIAIKIGFPETWKDYSSIDIKTYELGGSLFESTININKFELKEIADKINEKIDKTQWSSPPQIVNAMYNPDSNGIIFMAAILQSPYYTYGAPREQNLGSLGSIVGHEITHAFDVTGAQFDKNGNIANWWTETDSKKYNELSQSLIDRFNQLEVKPGAFVNGEFTLGENTADLAGVSVALDVMKKLEDPNYDLFFKSYASLWKAVMTPEFQDMLLMRDPHSPDKYRVNEVLKQLEEFHKTYNTSEGDEMFLDPNDRVKIW